MRFNAVCVPLLLVALTRCVKADWTDAFFSGINPYEEMRDMFASESQTKVTKDREELDYAPSKDQVDPDDKSKSDEDDSSEDEDELVSSVPFDAPFRGLFDLISGGGVNSWTKGPNVCTSRQETVMNKTSNSQTSVSPSSNFRFIGINMAHIQTCRETSNKYVCTTIKESDGKMTKTKVVYQCCPGHRRLKMKSMCEKVETKSVTEWAKELGANEFVDQIEKQGLTNDVNAPNKTVFLPLELKDEGKKEMTNEVSDADEFSAKDQMRNYVVDGVLDTNDMENEMILRSEVNTTLRINGYTTGVVTVNCVPLNKTDLMTAEGLVHTVKGALPPVTHTVAQILDRREFSKFKQLLIDVDLMPLVKAPGPKTVLAVTNEGVDKLDSKHAVCLRTILQHHILRHTFCSSAVPNKENVLVLDSTENVIKFSRDDDSHFVVDDETEMTDRDIMGSDGVVHVVELLVRPPSATSFTDLLTTSNHTRFLGLLKKAGFEREIEKSNATTIIVPPESEMDQFEEITDPQELRQKLAVHVIKGKVKAEDMTNGQHLKTESSDVLVTVKSNFLSRITGGGSPPSLQCKALARIDGHFCNGIAHTVRSPLTQTTSSLLDIIAARPELSIYREILSGTALEKEMATMHDVTVLAPSNEGFKSIGDDNMKTLKEDKRLADEILRSSILKETICCSNVVPSSWPFITTSPSLSGTPVTLHKILQTGKILFDRVMVTECDLLHTGGILHIMGGVLVSPNNPGLGGDAIVMRKPGSEIILAGI